MERLLQRHLIAILGAGALALIGCDEDDKDDTGEPTDSGTVTDTADTPPGDFTDTVCMNIDEELDCPVDPEPADVFGINYCDEIVAVGELISEGEAWSWHGKPEEGLKSCCYVGWMISESGEPECAIGRPLLHEGRVVVASSRRGEGWSDAARPAVDALSIDERQRLAAFWTRMALLEQASVAAFSRLSLQLMALGAPAALLADTHRAALDELDHAARCFSLASAYAGHDIAPGPLPLPAALPLASSLADLAASCALEGCIGETLSVAMAAEQLAGTTDPAVAAALSAIVRDESRHASLSWAVVRWALQVGGAPVRQRLEAIFSEASLPGIPAESGDAGTAGHGLPDPSVLRGAARRGLEAVVLPAAAAHQRQHAEG